MGCWGEGREGGPYPLQKAQSPDIRCAAALQSEKEHLILRGGMVVVVGGESTETRRGWWSGGGDGLGLGDEIGRAHV